eukprot:4980458-Karenia_brevis.AAC.1
MANIASKGPPTWSRGAVVLGMFWFGFQAWGPLGSSWSPRRLQGPILTDLGKTLNGFWVDFLE